MPPTNSYNPASLSQVSFSPDNELVLIAQQSVPGEPGVIVWRRQTGEKVREFHGLCFAFAPDGKHIACGGWEGIELYEFATGKLIRAMRGQQSAIESLTFSPDGQTLISKGRLPRPLNGGERRGEIPQVVHVWDKASGRNAGSVLHVAH